MPTSPSYRSAPSFPPSSRPSGTVALSSVAGTQGGAQAPARRAGWTRRAAGGRPGGRPGLADPVNAGGDYGRSRRGGAVA